MAPSRGPHDNADSSRRLSVIASRLSGLCLSNHGLAPVANEFHAFGTFCPRYYGAGRASRKSFTALAGSLSHLSLRTVVGHQGTLFAGDLNHLLSKRLAKNLQLFASQLFGAGIGSNR